ncbi:MAG: TonB-dependent receptor [Gammaproteobacteria bacterium]|nr:TonB-dependent receptor [Gammaproteobacteria bacterium]
MAQSASSSIAAVSVNEKATPAEKTQADSHVKSLGGITVIAGRLSSLPGYIPTTIEGITASDITEKINATDAQDALKYFPSLVVRKRFIGDFDHAVLSTRASGTGNSARSLVFADGILLSNLLGNGAAFTPRWGLVAPEEIERVDVLYGPFSAAYSGNSVGAVVDYITRMPHKFEGSVKLSGFSQQFKLYNTDATYKGNQVSATVGNRHGDFSWWLSLNRLDNEGQPIAFATKLLSTGITSTAGTPVTGAVFGQNPRNQDQLLSAATNQINLIQENAKLKLAYDVTPTIRASYLIGMWTNDAVRNVQPYLFNAQGLPVYSGSVNIAGRQYNIAATEIAPSRQDLQHIMQGVSVKSNARSEFDWEIAGSVYDYSRNISRAPTSAAPASFSGGAGRITDSKDTGWSTLSLKGIWRPGTTGPQDAGRVGAHLVDFGFQREAYKLRTLVSDTPDWIAGSAAARFSAFQGNATLQSIYVQDTWRFAEEWRTTIGLRAESWKANNGALSNATATQTFVDRSESNVSPKFALAFLVSPDWILKASVGRAVRHPTVSELYQGTISTNTIVNNDPNLKPEKSWTTELTAERDLADLRGFAAGGSWRTTAFFETTQDALYSQTNVTVFPNITNIQNVDNIRTKGVEVALQLNDLIWRGVDLQASYTFADSRIVQNDKFPASVGKWQIRVPRHRATILATWRVNEQFSTTLGVRSASKQFNTLDNSDPNGQVYTGVSAYTVIDLRLAYKFDKHWTLSAGIDNLTNYQYWSFHPYPQRTVFGDLKWTF